MIEHADAATLNRFVRKAVSEKVDLVATDESKRYDYLNVLGFPHDTVKHSAGEYVRGEVHTQNLDSFWSLLKRGVFGTYHNVSKTISAALPCGVSVPFQYRKNPDIFGKAVAGC